MIPVSCSLVGWGGLSLKILPWVYVNPTNGKLNVKAVILGGGVLSYKNTCIIIIPLTSVYMYMYNSTCTCTSVY